MNKLPFEKVKRELVVKKDSKTSPKFGFFPDKRPVENLLSYGIVNIDKPKGPTSHQVSAYVRQILKLDKAGHSGTLDPGVTGILPVALGSGTRISQLLLTAGKEYVALMHIHKEVPEGKVYNTFKEFVGKIKQLPPVKSAIKRQTRERSVYYCDIIEIDGQDVLFKIGCEAGLYIRKFCHDFGKKLGVGAHMAELRRTKAGPFNEETICTLQDVVDALHYWNEKKDERIRKVIQPVENAVKHLPKIVVIDSAADSLCHGANLNIPGIASFETGIEKGNIVAVMTLKGELVCYGLAVMTSDEIKEKEKGLAIKTEKVFMLPGTYPKSGKVNID